MTIVGTKIAIWLVDNNPISQIAGILWGEAAEKAAQSGPESLDIWLKSRRKRSQHGRPKVAVADGTIILLSATPRRRVFTIKQVPPIPYGGQGYCVAVDFGARPSSFLYGKLRAVLGNPVEIRGGKEGGKEQRVERSRAWMFPG